MLQGSRFGINASGFMVFGDLGKAEMNDTRRIPRFAPYLVYIRIRLQMPPG